MIAEKYSCRRCGSENIIKNGRNRYGNQQYYCKDCKNCRVLESVKNYTEEFKELVIRVYQERPSMRGLQRLFGVSRPTIAKWLKKKASNLLPLHEILLDRTTWVALCRRTRQILSFNIGSRDGLDCLSLVANQPYNYLTYRNYSDFYASCKKFPFNTQVSKNSGKTAHIENWNGILRQRNSRYVRKTLSYSKNDYWHQLATKLFIFYYNLDIKNSYCP